MRAVRIAGEGKAHVVDLPSPVADAGDVLVRVVSAAVCGTDYKLTRGGGGSGQTLGHEVAGYLPDGSLVGVHPDTGCGSCGACRAGMTNRCRLKISLGIDRDGGLAGIVAVPAAHAIPIRGVAPSVAPLLEPLACCVGAVNRMPPFAGPALVVGAGAMGILLMWVLRAAGRRVAVSQSSPARRAQAEALGADVTMGPQERAQDVLGERPEAVFVTAPGSEPLSWALDQVAEGGAVHAFAGTPGGVLVDVNRVHYRHLALIGGTGSGLRDYLGARDLVLSGAVDLSLLPHDRTDLYGAAARLSADEPPTSLRTLVDVSDLDR